MAEAAFNFTQGRTTLDDLKELLNVIDSQSENKIVLNGADTDLDVLLNSAMKDEGLRWRLDFLNKSLGSLREGDFGFLFKRPESGGTAFCASEVSNMLSQTDRKIVWINNEEANDKVILRVYQAYFGVSLQELLGDSHTFRQRFKDEVGDRFQFFGIDRSNKRDIERIIDLHNPRFVIYDQIDKIQGFDADREDLKLGEIYIWARNLTKKGHSALGITQADGSAEGVKWLNMGHVANAKTSKQAEADYIIGLGRSSDPETENIRYITLCKNKLLGSHDSIPQLRHGRAEVLIQPEIMRFKDLVNYG